MDRQIKIFISYSWDNDAHKEWILAFASRLLDTDFDVILDVWDTDLGDDLTLFMENSVRDADRVLMVCTDQYVRKADAGKGGVGYERMIVTGELVRNLGQKKFIPVIREGTNEVVTPAFLATRKYIDFRNDAKFEFSIAELIESLRKTTISSKPISATPNLGSLQLVPTSEATVDESIYSKAARFASTDDVLAWRKLVQEQKRIFKTKLFDWRVHRDQNPPTVKTDLSGMADEVVEAASPLIVMALVGVQSTHSKFTDQRALIDELAQPHEWSHAGRVLLIAMPETLGFVYHTVHGAVCMESGQPDLAMQLATTSIIHKERSYPIFLNLRLMGWSDSLGSNTAESWKYLYGAFSRWSWLASIFADEVTFRTSLIAYYMALSFIEYLDALAHNQQLKPGHLNLSVPIFFLDEDAALCQRALRMVASAASVFKEIAQHWNVSQNHAVVKWPEWIAICNAWGSPARRYFPRVNPMNSFMEVIGWASRTIPPAST